MNTDSAAIAVRRELADALRNATRVHHDARLVWIERAWSALRTLEQMAADSDLSDARRQIVAAEADVLALGLFEAAPLVDQCQALGLPLEHLALDRTANGWVVGQTAFKKPEEATLAVFRRQGFVGTSCEGAAPLMLMKCAALDFLASINPFSGRNDACLRFFEAQCIMFADRRQEIISAIRSATTIDIQAHFQEITSLEKYKRLYPEMDETAMLRLWEAITPVGVSQLAERVVADPGLRAGWPDLTLERGGEVRFVEVKTSDKLHNSQRTVIRDVLLPLGAKVSVVQLRKAR